jgi:two-component system OmpR family sensor kinase
LLKSEKKSLYRFLTLYVMMVIFGISLLALYYYESQKKLMLTTQRVTLAQYAYIQTKRLKVLHHFFPERDEYPRDPRFTSAIYDIEFNRIFSLNRENDIHFDEEIYLTDHGHIHFVKGLDTYYLGTRYLVIEVKDDGVWLVQIWKDIALYGSMAFILFLLFGLYLAKLFLKPMRDSIMLLDRFIKDTTHELNTPLSAILANIEMMDTEVMVEKNRKKLERINIAAKTVSTLYKDLTFLTLEQEKKNEDELLDIRAIIKDRVEYFDVLARSKLITFELQLEDVKIVMDRRKFVRIVDNLISNAIKYNKRNGTIKVILQKGRLIVSDTGMGISEEKIPFMFDRYLRFNSSEGGFGIGLSIVKKILDEYGMTIYVESEKNIGTRMIIVWQYLN